MKKNFSIFLIFIVFLLIVGVGIVVFLDKNPSDKVKKENISDSKCINALKNKDYVVRKMNIDDVNIEFDFLNCNMEETNEKNKYLLKSPNNGYLIESYLSSFSPVSTALEIHDTYINMDKYLGQDVTVSSWSTEDGILYRIISVVPAEAIDYEQNFYYEYIIICEVDKDKTVVLKIKSEVEESPSLLFETVLNTFKIIKE